MAGRWLTADETRRLQLLSTKAERDAFVRELAKTLRERYAKQPMKVGAKEEA